MAAADYIGRIGALALFLGVGTAVATGLGAAEAHADSTGSTSSASDSKAGAPASPGSMPTVRDAQTHSSSADAAGKKPDSPASGQGRHRRAESSGGGAQGSAGDVEPSRVGTASSDANDATPKTSVIPSGRSSNDPSPAPSLLRRASALSASADEVTPLADLRIPRADPSPPVMRALGAVTTVTTGLSTAVKSLAAGMPTVPNDASNLAAPLALASLESLVGGLPLPSAATTLANGNPLAVTAPVTTGLSTAVKSLAAGVPTVPNDASNLAAPLALASLESLVGTSPLPSAVTTLINGLPLAVTATLTTGLPTVAESLIAGVLTLPSDAPSAVTTLINGLPLAVTATLTTGLPTVAESLIAGVLTLPSDAPSAVTTLINGLPLAVTATLTTGLPTVIESLIAGVLTLPSGASNLAEPLALTSLESLGGTSPLPTAATTPSAAAAAVTPSVAATPASVADQVAIENVETRYATAIDTRNFAEMNQVFTNDAVINYSYLGTYTGLKNIDTILALSQLPMGTTEHRVSNTSVTMIDDTHATARTYVDANLPLFGNITGVEAVGYYDDTLVKGADGNWLISSRTFTLSRIGVLPPALPGAVTYSQPASGGTPPSVADQVAIENLQTRYATAIDTRNFAEMNQVFTNDAVINYSYLGTYTGLNNIDTILALSQLPMGTTEHRVGNVSVSMIDATHATSRTYVDADLPLFGNITGVEAVGYYDDTLVKGADGTWRISSRTFTLARLSLLPPALPGAVTYSQPAGGGTPPSAADQVAIDQLQTRYTTAIDTRNFAEMNQVFTNDAVINYSYLGTYTGLNDIDTFLALSQLTMGTTQHRVGNTSVSMIDDTHATARTYVDVDLPFLGNITGLEGVGYYDDTLVKGADGTWRISSRTFTLSRLTVLPLALPGTLTNSA